MQHLPKLPYLKCPECEKPAINGITHTKCKKRLSLDGVISFYPYTGIVKKAIKGIKYRFAYRIVKDIFQNIPVETILFWKRHVLKDSMKNIVIPIPLHASRLRFRGFNQAEIIAQYVSHIVSIPVSENVIERVHMTEPQVTMKYRKERFINMKNAFRVKEGSKQLSGATVLLVDDVFTTGATLKSATAILKLAGAKAVWGMTIAQ